MKIENICRIRIIIYETDYAFLCNGIAHQPLGFHVLLLCYIAKQSQFPLSLFSVARESSCFIAQFSTKTLLRDARLLLSRQSDHWSLQGHFYPNPILSKNISHHNFQQMLLEKLIPSLVAIFVIPREKLSLDSYSRERRRDNNTSSNKQTTLYEGGRLRIISNIL